VILGGKKDKKIYLVIAALPFKAILPKGHRL
jgi:hypothetical protein